jgi:hypothetical protein
MATREVWFGSQGPQIFDDTEQWPDGELMCGARLPQAFLDDEPSQPEHAVRLSTLGVYATTSMVNSVVLSEATLRTTADSTIDSKVASVVSSCDSKILSLSANDSTLDSMIDSNAIRCSTLESKALSGVFE